MRKILFALKYAFRRFLEGTSSAANPDVPRPYVPPDPCAYGHNFSQSRDGAVGFLFCQRCGETRDINPVKRRTEERLVRKAPNVDPKRTSIEALKGQPWVRDANLTRGEDGSTMTYVITREPGRHVPTEPLIRELINELLPKGVQYSIHVQWPQEMER